MSMGQGQGGFPPPPGGMSPGMGPGVPGGPNGRPGAARPGPTKGVKAPKKDKPVTRRLISTNRTAAIILGVLALGAAFLLSRGGGVETTFVVRSISSVPAMLEIGIDRLEAIEIDPLYLEKDAVTGDSADEALDEAAALIEGARTQLPIAQGAQIRPEMFSADAILTDPLAPDERLVSVRADITSAVAGTLRTGDHIDVISYLEGNPGIAGVVAVDVEIVSVTLSSSGLSSAATSQSSESGRDLKPSDVLPADPIPGTYVLRVKAEQALRLSALDAATTLYMSYRGTNAVDAVVDPVDVLSLICGGPGQYQSASDESAPSEPGAEGESTEAPAPAEPVDLTPTEVPAACNAEPIFQLEDVGAPGEDAS